MLLLLAACGGAGAPATSTPDAQSRASTATAAADAMASTAAFSATFEAGYAATQTATALRRPLCLVDAETREELQQVYERLYDAGMDLNESNPTAGIALVEIALGYGVLADCREDGGTPSSGTATPVACIADAEGIQRLRDAGIAGLSLVLLGTIPGFDEAAVASFWDLNERLLARADELATACGLAPRATPVASPIAP
jgi:hypothetical protein